MHGAMERKEEGGMQTGRTEGWERLGGGQHHRVALVRKDGDSPEQGCNASPCPRDRELQPAPPCLSFPHRSTLHPGTWPREARAAPTNPPHPADAGPSPTASCGHSCCVPTAGAGGQQKGKGLGTDGPGVQGVVDAIISLLGRRVWRLLGTAELPVVVAHG